MAISQAADPYKVLGLSRDATAAEIRSSFKKLMLKCHPDKVHDESQKEEKAQQYQKVMEAYELLSDPKKKRRYDVDIQRQAAAESRQSNATMTADPVPDPEVRDTSEERKKDYSRERSPRQENGRDTKTESVHEESSSPKEMPKEREAARDRDTTREHEAPKERDAHHEREVPKAKETPPEMPTHEKEAARDLPREKETPREKESSRDRERIQKEPRPESKEHNRSRDSSKEKDRKHGAKPETAQDYKLHQLKYEEERRLEEEKLKAARNKMLQGDIPMSAPLGGSTLGGRGDSHERARRREEERLRSEHELRDKLKHVREQTSYEMEEVDEFNMDDLPPKSTDSRRGSTQKREPSPKDSPASSRERKSSHSPSYRKESVSPVREESLHSSSRSIPIHTPYGSAPPPVPGSTFPPFSSSTSPRRRHSVSSQDPLKSARLNREDSGYSSPSYPGTPMGPEGKTPPAFVRSSTDSDHCSGWRKHTIEVFFPDDSPEAAIAAVKAQAQAAAAGGYPIPGHIPRRKTTSHHPLETANLTSSPPLHSAEYRKSAPVSNSASGPTSYYYSPTSASYYSPTHPSQQFSHSSGSSSVHPQQSPSRSRHHHHSSSPHSSPKIGSDGFSSLNGVRSPSVSGASTVHSSASYYSRPDPYYAHPVARGAM